MTTTASQEAREAEVTQADEALANEIYAHCFEFDFDGAPFDLKLAKQIIARHRQQAERGEGWRPIETAPRDEPILAALKVHHRNGDTWWERHVIVIDSETGTISDMDYHHGWEADNYQVWCTLPSAPEAV